MAFKDFATDDIFTEADADMLMRQSVIVCTSGTRPAGGTEGMFIYETDTKSFAVHNGTTWARAGAFDQSAYGIKQSNSGTVQTVTSTSFVAGSPVVGVAFNCPPSGAVFITVTGYLEQANNTFETRLGWELRDGVSVGSGTIITGALYYRALTTTRGVTTGGEALICASHRFYQAGLSPLAAYNVRCMQMVSGGTGSIDWRQVLVEPAM